MKVDLAVVKLDREQLYEQLINADAGLLNRGEIADIYFRAFCTAIGTSPHNDVEAEVISWVKAWTKGIHKTHVRPNDEMDQAEPFFHPPVVDSDTD